MKHLTKMKKLNSLLRKCKSLSRQLGRSSSYSSLSSMSTKERSKSRTILHQELEQEQYDYTDHEIDPRRVENGETIYVGSSRRSYVIDSKYLTHPLLNALIEKSQRNPGDDNIAIKCEVVLFDHLLWMLENGDPSALGSESLEELADLYVL